MPRLKRKEYRITSLTLDVELVEAMRELVYNENVERKRLGIPCSSFSEKVEVMISEFLQKKKQEKEVDLTHILELKDKLLSKGGQ